jgi:hypothetical protein
MREGVTHGSRGISMSTAEHGRLSNSDAFQQGGREEEQQEQADVHAIVSAVG